MAKQKIINAEQTAKSLFWRVLLAALIVTFVLGGALTLARYRSSESVQSKARVAQISIPVIVQGAWDGAYSDVELTSAAEKVYSFVVRNDGETSMEFRFVLNSYSMYKPNITPEEWQPIAGGEQLTVTVTVPSAAATDNGNLVRGHFEYRQVD